MNHEDFQRSVIEILVAHRKVLRPWKLLNALG